MTTRTSQTTEAWKLFRRILDDMTAVVQGDSENDLEKLDELKVLGRVTAFCLEPNLHVEADGPRLF